MTVNAKILQRENKRQQMEGLGRELGVHSLELYTQIKSVFVKL